MTELKIHYSQPFAILPYCFHLTFNNNVCSHIIKDTYNLQQNNTSRASTSRTIHFSQ